MTLSYQQGTSQLNDFRKQMAGLREQMREVQRSMSPEVVDNYSFDGPDGSKTLGDLFGAQRDLIVIHNMGTSCAYCTLWGDGFNGVYEHLRQRAAFVMTSPDSVAVQQRFADSRGWRFPMLSHAGSDFAENMGFGSADQGWHPGVSVFQQHDGNIVRVSNAEFGPGDDFCMLWHLFDLLPAGTDGFVAKHKYG